MFQRNASIRRGPILLGVSPAGDIYLSNTVPWIKTMKRPKILIEGVNSAQICQ
jgi:hypothetical protein